MFLDDLSSEPGKPVDRELDDLGLPKLPDMKEDDFLKLCEVGVK